ncbi:MAG: glutamine-hydrolyzing GMP synthase, partial [Lachnospiraceae bacterium]|nr:glutamine-hydrolyzing GMP synthase [Lachnospiraceae bacterium]
MTNEMIIVLDFGGQYNQLIARRVRECNVYAEVCPYTLSLDEIKKKNPKGIIFTGGPNSVYDPASPHYDKAIFELGVPILGICYGSQLMAYTLGGVVETAPVSEYGKTDIEINTSSKLFHGIDEKTVVWMSHTDYIANVPAGFSITGHSSVCPVASMEDASRGLYATQFHPEVMHTVDGKKMISNFVYTICGCHGDWTMDSFVESKIKEIREKVGDKKALCDLSGGVDSSVAAVLMSKAIGKNLTCVFVDHGLLRKNEGDEVEAVFGPNGNYELNFIRVN